MSLLNKLFTTKKNKLSTKPVETLKEKKIEEKTVATPKKTTPAAKTTKFKPGKVLVSPHTAEKATAGEAEGKYVFKVSPKANKIEIAKEVGRSYNVKVISVNVLNIHKKARRVGKTMGFKTGYKKAIVTLAKGQTIEHAK